MTDKVKFTQAEIRRAIRAAQREGLPIKAVRPDGLIIIGETIELAPNQPNQPGPGASNTPGGRPWWDADFD